MFGTSLFHISKKTVFTGIAFFFFLCASAQNPFNVFLKEFPEGETISKYENGTVSSSFTKVSGNVTGDIKEYYPNGKLRYVVHMKDGLCTDTSRWFLIDGLPDMLLFCRNDTALYGERFTYKDSLLSEKHQYYLSGTGILVEKILSIQVEDIDINFKRASKKTGALYIRESFYDIGRPGEKSIWLSGKKHGEQLKFYPNGEKQFIKHYTNGIKEGVFEEYDENGVVKKTCYTAGKETPCN